MKKWGVTGRRLVCAASLGAPSPDLLNKKGMAYQMSDCAPPRNLEEGQSRHTAHTAGPATLATMLKYAISNTQG